MIYHPDLQIVDLDVSQGTVYTTLNGENETDYTAGQKAHFDHVFLSPGPGQTSNSPNPKGLLGNPALIRLNNDFQSGILVNHDNNLSAADQNLSIVLHVAPGEAVP